MNNPAQKLHHEFVRLGSMRFRLKNKMLAILPEIFTSGIWKKYAGRIEEYAGKYGDISNSTVKKRLRLEENLSDKPFLKAAIATIGVHKVAMVAKITTPEMDKAMADKLCNMSKIAVQSLSKELRAGQNQSSLCSAVPLTKKIELDENSTFLFLKLKKKLGKNLSDKEFLKQILEERERQEFPQKKEERASSVVLQKASKSMTHDDGNVKVTHAVTDQKSVPGETFGIPDTGRDGPAKNSTSDGAAETQPRYVKAKKRRQAIAPTNGKCAYPNCNSPYAVLHHVDRYSESKNHDSIIPLCKVHHEFVHNNLIRNEKFSANRWELAVTQKDTQTSLADVLYKKYRLGALSS